MSPKTSVSAIIITKNEAPRIAACLEGVSWADEKIVIDSGSADETVELARKYGAKVTTCLSRDFSELRNTGAHNAKGAWLLYVDADESVTTDLRNEIQRVAKTGDFDAYFIPRKNYYLGHVWPSRDGMVRLIRRSALVNWTGILHEHAVIRGSTGKLQNYFIHDTHRTLEEMVDKTNEWSGSEALLRFKSLHPPISWWRMLRVMMSAFWDSYVKQGGWRAGTPGLIESMYQAFSMFVTYAKLWELQQNNHE